MTYKSLLSIITDPKIASPALEEAIAIARVNDAHLEVLCVGVDRTQTGYYYAGASVQFMQEALEQAKTESKEIEDFVAERLKRSEIKWSSETAIAQLTGLNSLVAHRARFNDLVILPRPYCDGCGQEQEIKVEASLFEGHSPVLIVPPQTEPKPEAKRIVLAWNQSPEAMAASRAALPFLKLADIVSIAMVEPPKHGPDRSDPGGALSQFLVRHGVKVEISVLAKTLPRVSDVLLRHAKDINADMMVMGAYGHSRFREAILGGATRYILEQTEIPVFMSH